MGAQNFDESTSRPSSSSSFTNESHQGHGNQPLHSGNLNKYPISSLPPPKPQSSRFNVFSFIVGKKRNRIPTTGELKQALEKLDKLTVKTLKQQQDIMEMFKYWGTGLPDSASRELVSNLGNILSGPMNMSRDLQVKLSAVAKQLDELCKLEVHRAHLETELQNTQKLYHRATYKGYPMYQLQSYQASYDALRNDFDETTLRYRNKLVILLKQSWQMVFTSMHEIAESEAECAELGFRMLAMFDSEPKHVVQSSIYQPLQYYTPILAPPTILHDESEISSSTPVEQHHQREEKPYLCEHCNKHKTDGKQRSENMEHVTPTKRTLSAGEARFARYSPRLSNEYGLNREYADDEKEDENLGSRKNMLADAIMSSSKGRTTDEITTHHGNSTRPYSNSSINPFTLS